MAYNPNQPRDPEGTLTGGQWTKAETAARAAAGLEPRYPPTLGYEEMGDTVWGITPDDEVVSMPTVEHSALAEENGLDSEEDFLLRGISGTLPKGAEFVCVYNTVGVDDNDLMDEVFAKWSEILRATHLKSPRLYISDSGGWAARLVEPH